MKELDTNIEGTQSSEQVDFISDSSFITSIDSVESGNLQDSSAATPVVSVSDDVQIPAVALNSIPFKPSDLNIDGQIPPPRSMLERVP